MLSETSNNARLDQYNSRAHFWHEILSLGTDISIPFPECSPVHISYYYCDLLQFLRAFRISHSRRSGESGVEVVLKDEDRFVKLLYSFIPPLKIKPE